MVNEIVKLFCFGASYSVALMSDLLGVKWSAKICRMMSLAFAGAGLAAHTIYLVYRALDANVVLLTTCFDSLLVLSWVLAVLYFCVRWCYPTVPVGLFVLPLILGLVVSASLLGKDSHRDLSGLVGIWGLVHGVILVGGAIAAAIGFVAGVMYLVQSSRLKAKRLPKQSWFLPSLEYLERLNHHGITVAFLLLTIGLGTGILLAIQQSHAGVTQIELLDPKVVSAGFMWLTFGFLLQARSWPLLRGRRVALLTIVGFALLLFTIIGVDLLMESWHQAGGGS